MRKAYALLGLLFLLVFIGAYLIFEKAEAPTVDDVKPLKSGFSIGSN